MESINLGILGEITAQSLVTESLSFAQDENDILIDFRRFRQDPGKRQDCMLIYV